MALADVTSFEVIRERHHPLIAGVLAGALVLYASPDLFSYATEHQWKLSELYSSGFDFASVATSFLFTFYTFVITSDGGFILKMRRSIYYRQMLDYTVRALILGVVLAISSLPMMVIDPLPTSKWDVSTFAVAGWTLIAVWTVAAFVRTARIFIVFATADN